MFLVFKFYFPFLIIFSLIFNVVAYGDNNASNACLICHEQLYSAAISTPNTHSVVKKGCTICHNIEKNPKHEAATTSQDYQKNMVLSLATLLGNDETYDKDNKYEIQIAASDLSGNWAKPVKINTSTQTIWNRPEKTFDIKEISDLKVESIKRGLYTTAVITWNTNVPATSKVEYGSFTINRHLSTSNNIFSRRHKITLKSLGNDGKYLLRVTSRDLNGNAMQSENLIFETYKGFNFTKYPEMQKPKVATPMLFNIGTKEDLFIRISANTPVKFEVKIREIPNKASRPCLGFVQTRHSTIKVCLQCHPQDASHPVGVRSNNPKIKVSDQLPTIENGIITCVSCHFPHGGNRKYFLRVDFNKEICAKCHSSYYDYLFKK